MNSSRFWCKTKPSPIQIKRNMWMCTTNVHFNRIDENRFTKVKRWFKCISNSILNNQPISKLFTLELSFTCSGYMLSGALIDNGQTFANRSLQLDNGPKSKSMCINATFDLKWHFYQRFSECVFHYWLWMLVSVGVRMCLYVRRTPQCEASQMKIKGWITQFKPYNMWKSQIGDDLVVMPYAINICRWWISSVASVAALDFSKYAIHEYYIINL